MHHLLSTFYLTSSFTSHWTSIATTTSLYFSFPFTYLWNSLHIYLRFTSDLTSGFTYILEWYSLRLKNHFLHLQISPVTFCVLPELTSNATSTELLFTLRFTSRQTSFLPRTSANLLHFTTCISVTLTSNFKWRWVLPHIMLDFSPFPPRLKLQSTPGFTSLYLNISSIVSLQTNFS